MFLSELGYSELVQRLFEKMTFFLVDPLEVLSVEPPTSCRHKKPGDPNSTMISTHPSPPTLPPDAPPPSAPRRQHLWDQQHE